MTPPPLRGLALAALVLASAAASAQAPLFSPLDGARVSLTPRQAELLDHLATRPAFVEADLVVADASVLGTAPAVSLALPGGEVTLEADTVERRGAADLSWGGGADGDPLTRGQFVVREGRVTGAVWAHGRVYAVRPLTGGLHAVAAFDASAYRDHDEAEYEAFQEADRPRRELEARLEAELRGGGGPQARAAVVTTVDVVVAYTAEVAAAEADPAAFAQLAVDAANATYTNTGMDIRLALLAAYETGTAATSNMSTDLSALQADGDGRFDEAHVWRDGYGGDLVALLGPSSGTYGACGLGYVNASANSAFTVTAYDCAVGNLSFAHEVGHNLGAQHDPYVTDPASLAYAYGQGTVNTAGRWRTVMAYNDECSDGGFSCARIPYWSDPDVTYDDTTAPENDGPTGDATERDNSRVLDERAPTVAAFRTAGTPPEVAVSSTSLAAALLPGGSGSEAFTVSNTAAPGSNDLAWSVRLENVTVPGAPARRAGNCTSGQTGGQAAYTSNYTTVASTDEAAQSFVPPCRGELTAVSPTVYYNAAPNTSWSGTLRVFEGAGTTGTEIASGPVSHTNGASGIISVPIPLSSPAEVSEGETYTWFLDLDAGSVGMLFDAGNPDPNGVGYAGPGAIYPQASWDFAYGLAFDPPAASWIEVNTVSGTVAAGASTPVTVSFDATGLSAGTYTADLVLTTSDPTNIEQTVTVTLSVEDTALAAADGFGWRILASPFDGTTVGTLAAQNLVQGTADSYPAADANLYTGYDGAAWTPAAASTDALASGYGFAWYLFDADIDADPADPNNSVSVALPMTLTAAGAEPTADVDVTLHADGDGWNLLGNPYAVEIDLSGVGAWTGAGALASYVGQVWQCAPNAADPVECIGSYTTTTLLGDVLPAWSGVFVQAASVGTLTFPHATRTVSTRRAAPRLIGFELAAADGAALDRAAAVVFQEGATDGFDPWDAEKLASLASPSVRIAFGGERDGEPILKAQDSRPFEPASFEVPVHVASEGAGPDLVLTWPRLDELPEDWALALTDRETGTTVDLRTADRYAFSVSEAAARTAAMPGVSARRAAEPPRFTLSVQTANHAVAEAPGPEAETWLGTPAPNPARARATVAYGLAEAGPARLTVLDLLGREVAVLAEGPHAAGAARAALPAGALAPGLYVVRLEAGGAVLTQRAVVAR